MSTIDNIEIYLLYFIGQFWLCTLENAMTVPVTQDCYDPVLITREKVWEMFYVETASAALLGILFGLFEMIKNDGNSASFCMTSYSVFVLYMAWQHRKIFIFYEASTVTRLLNIDREACLSALNKGLQGHKDSVDQMEIFFWAIFILPLFIFYFLT